MSEKWNMSFTLADQPHKTRSDQSRSSLRPEWDRSSARKCGWHLLTGTQLQSATAQQEAVQEKLLKEEANLD